MKFCGDAAVEIQKEPKVEFLHSQNIILIPTHFSISPAEFALKELKKKPTTFKIEWGL